MNMSRLGWSTLLICASLLAGTWARAQTPPPGDIDAEPLYGLPSPSVDLRSMLRGCVVNEGVKDLAVGSARRNQAILTHGIPAYSQSIREWVTAALGPLPFGAQGGPLHVRAVSKFTRQ